MREVILLLALTVAAYAISTTGGPNVSTPEPVKPDPITVPDGAVETQEDPVDEPGTFQSK